MDHYRRGKEAFTNYFLSVQANEDSTLLQTAEALAQLGDWYLVFEKYQTARNHYQQAYQMLAESEGSKELADDYLGNPSPLRFLNNHEDFTVTRPEHDSELGIDVAMKVTRGGDLRYIEFVDAPEDMSKDELWAIRHQLENTRFRPGIKDGVVIEVPDYVWRYPIQPLD